MKRPSPSILASMLLSLCTLNAQADYGLTRERMDAVDTSKWKCKFCPDETQTRGHVSAYAGYSGEDASSVHFRNSKADATGLQGELEADLRQSNALGHVAVQTDHLGSDNSQSGVEFDGDMGLRGALTHSHSTVFTDPHGQTVFAEAGTSRTLPAGWVDQATTTTMTFAPLSEVEAFRQRDNVSAEVAQTFGPNGPTVSANYRQIQRDGRLWTQGSILNDVTSLTEHRDDKTRELTLGVSMPYEVSQGQGAGGVEFFQSEYDNSEQSLAWDNPFIAAFAGADRGRLATAPDNEFQRWRAFTHYANGAHKWSASFARGEGEQDEVFLPYTENSLIAVNALPRDSYEGEVQTTHLRLGWDVRITSALQMSTRYRLNERENTSAELDYDPVLTDSLPLNSVSNEVYSHKKSQLDLAFDWYWRPQTRLSYDIEYEQFERERESAADTLTLSLCWREKWNPLVTSTIKLLGSERKQDDTATSLAPNQNPYFSEFTTADRLRDGIQFDLNWRAGRDVQVATNLALQRDDFDETLVGVTEAEDKALGFSIDWALSKELSTQWTFQRNWMLWRMDGSAAASFPTWSSEQSDQFDTLIWSLRRDGLLDRKLTLGFDYVLASSTGKTDLGIPGQYTDQKDHNQSILGYADYQWRPQWQLRFESLYERYTSTNPMLINLDTLPRVIGNAVQDDNDSEWLFGVRVRYLIE